MKNFKKAIALLLSMLMILAVAPISAFADDANDYNTINVTFDAGDGVCSFDSKTYTVGMEFGLLPTCEAREGYEFLGWYTQDEVLITETSLVTFSEDITLYAKWNDLNAAELNPFSLIGQFFEMIAETLRIVIEFLENMFTGSGNNELEQIK